MTPEVAAEIAMCNECISHQSENAGPDHIIVKYRAALIKLGAQAAKIGAQAEKIKRLQMIISEPVESFGTAELLAWAAELQAIIAKWPESERGNLPFVMEMGSHLEKFANGWNSPTIKWQAAYAVRLEAAYLDEARENIQATREFLQERQTPEEYLAEIDALARAALERIKNGAE